MKQQKLIMNTGNTCELWSIISVMILLNHQAKNQNSLNVNKLIQKIEGMNQDRYQI